MYPIDLKGTCRLFFMVIYQRNKLCGDRVIHDDHKYTIKSPKFPMVIKLEALEVAIRSAIYADWTCPRLFSVIFHDI